MPGDPSVQRHSFRDRLRASQAAGFDGLCLHFRDYAQLIASGAGDADLRSMLAEYRQVVPSVEFLSDWHLSGDAARDHRAQAFAAAAGFGATTVNVGADAGPSSDLTRPEDFVAPLLDLCDAAAARGVRIALEYVAWGAFQRLSDLVALAALTGGRAGLLLDIWHLARRGVGEAELDDVPPEMVFGLQVSDAAGEVRGTMLEDTVSRRFCGDGDLDVAGFLTGAARRGWHAPLAVEVISPEAAGMEVSACARRAYDTTAAQFPDVWKD